MENLWRIATGQDPNRQDYEGIEFWSNPERSGWLTKQGDYIKTWRRRWFVLKRGKLLWFKDQSSALTRGSIPRGVISVGDCLTVKGAEDVVNKPFAFEISSGNITMFFIADNEKEKEEWINSIGRSIVQHSRSVTDSEVLDYDQRRWLLFFLPLCYVWFRLLYLCMYVCLSSSWSDSRSLVLWFCSVSDSIPLLSFQLLYLLNFDRFNKLLDYMIDVFVKKNELVSIICE